MQGALCAVPGGVGHAAGGAARVDTLARHVRPRASGLSAQLRHLSRAKRAAAAATVRTGGGHRYKVCAATHTANTGRLLQARQGRSAAARSCRHVRCHRHDSHTRCHRHVQQLARCQTGSSFLLISF